MNKSDLHQDLFAYTVNNLIKPNSVGYWVDIGARNFGMGFGQNNTEFLYSKGWGGLSMDIGDFGSSYASLDPNRVTFKQIDCTNPDLLLETFQENNVPLIVDYLSFDIDDSTKAGMAALKNVIDSESYIFNCITIEHDSYRVGTSIRDFQREFFKELGYTMVVELDMYEDWWIHNSVYNTSFEVLDYISKNIKRDSFGFSAGSIQSVKNTILELLNEKI